MESTKEKFVREFTEAFAKFNIKITPLTFDEAYMNKDCLENNECGEITKGDVFGIIDYLIDGLGDYIENSGGRPYDDDEILNIRTWVLRCTIWLNEKIKEME
jgi:hypothetical protein